MQGKPIFPGLVCTIPWLRHSTCISHKKIYQESELKNPKLRNPGDIIINGKALSDILQYHSDYIESNGKEGRKAFLRDADLQGVDLQGAELQDANFQEANLQFAYLSVANLQGADLQDTDLQDADLQGADLQGANLRGADLQNDYLQEANLKNSILLEANLQGADLQSANLAGADLRSANLQGANLSSANLQGSNLQGGDLTGANLQEANLSNTTLQGANLQDATLQGAVLAIANLQEANLRRANLQGINLQGVNLQGADLQGAYLQGADLMGANLSIAYLREANLRKTSLQGVNLQGANLQGTDLQGADLSYADLRFARLNGASITGAIFHGVSHLNWEIEGIVCDYIFTDIKRKMKLPKERNFKKNEFEVLYKSYPAVEFVFENGLNGFDPILIQYVVEQIGKRHPEMNLSVLSFDKRGIFPKVTFSLASEEMADTAWQEIKTEYDKVVRMADEEIDGFWDYIKDLSRQPRQIFQVPKEDFIQEKDEDSLIPVEEIRTAVEAIKEAVQEAPEDLFVGKRKNHVLHTLDRAIGTLWGTAGIEGARQLVDLNQYFGPELNVEVEPHIETIREFFGL